MKKRILIIPILLSANSYLFADVKDLICKKIPISIYYAGYKDYSNNQKYVYFNGKHVIDITPPQTIYEKKTIKVISNDFVELPLIKKVSDDCKYDPALDGWYDSYANSCVKNFTDYVMKFNNSGHKAIVSPAVPPSDESIYLANKEIPIEIYYAGYIDAKGEQRYVYYNGKNIIDITPPANSSEKKSIEVITNKFSKLPEIVYNTNSDCKYDPALDGWYDSDANVCSPAPTKYYLQFYSKRGVPEENPYSGYYVEEECDKIVSPFE